MHKNGTMLKLNKMMMMIVPASVTLPVADVTSPVDPPASSTHTTTTMLTSTSNMENTSDTSAHDRAIASWARLDPPILPNGEEINAKKINFDYNEEDHIRNVQHDSNGNYSHHPVRMTVTKSFGARDDAIHHRDHTNDTVVAIEIKFVRSQ
jgi:hypothetical protein